MTVSMPSSVAIRHDPAAGDLVSPVLMFGRWAELEIATMLDPATPGLGLLADESALADRELLVG